MYETALKGQSYSDEEQQLLPGVESKGGLGVKFIELDTPPNQLDCPVLYKILEY